MKEPKPKLVSIPEDQLATYKTAMALMNFAGNYWPDAVKGCMDNPGFREIAEEQVGELADKIREMFDGLPFGIAFLTLAHVVYHFHENVKELQEKDVEPITTRIQ